ncbi:MAG: hypothetical protein MJY71_02430 [Bacteroidaceae bacterium]|nr:hypothetical protein [Bacteroidaceae bacterium]
MISVAMMSPIALQSLAIESDSLTMSPSLSDTRGSREICCDTRTSVAMLGGAIL